MFFDIAAGVRVRERHLTPVAIRASADAIASRRPSNFALSIASRSFYTTPRKPHDGSGTAPPAALRTLPLRRRSANPLKYQWLSLPVAWTTRKHIDDAGGRDYLTPDAAGCPERHNLHPATPDIPYDLPSAAPRYDRIMPVTCREKLSQFDGTVQSK